MNVHECSCSNNNDRAVRCSLSIRDKRVCFVLAHTVYFAAIPKFFRSVGFQENEVKGDKDKACY